MLTATILAISMAAPVDARKTTYVPIAVIEITEREMRQRARQTILRCRMARWHEGDVATLRRRGLEPYEIEQIAYDLSNEPSRCSRDLDTAIALFRGLAVPDALQTSEPEAARGLHFALMARGQPDDVERATDIARMLWLRGDFGRAPALSAWTEAERLAWLTRDDVWAYLQSQRGQRMAMRAPQELLFALRHPASPRRDMAAAVMLMEQINPVGAARLLLAGEDVSRDVPRAEAILARAAQHDEAARLILVPIIAQRAAGLTGAARRAIVEPLRPFADQRTPGGRAARTALVPILIEDLATAPVASQGAAIGALAQYVALGTPAAEAPLLAWTTPRLRDADPAVQRIARGNIIALLRQNNAEARWVLDADMASAGGLVDHRTLTLADFRTPQFVVDDDYPSSAQREGASGIVGAIATVDPSGRAISVEIIHSSGNDAIDNAVRSNAMRRIRVHASVTNGRYIRAVLPLVHFILPEDGLSPVAAPPEGAIIVRARWIERPILETPIPVTTIAP